MALLQQMILITKGTLYHQLLLISHTLYDRYDDFLLFDRQILFGCEMILRYLGLIQVNDLLFLRK